MSTYVLVHGASHGAWCWSLVSPFLEARGHAVVTMDLPIEDPSAGRTEYAAAVVAAVGSRSDVVLVVHSLGVVVVPEVCARVPVSSVVLLAAMVMAPGQTGFELLAEAAAEREDAGDEVDYFYEDVPADLAAAARARWRNQTARALQEPWPAHAWPAVRTSYLLCRDDRLLPAPWVRRVVAERLGLVPEELDGSHSPFLSRPEALVERLERL
ncbi:alpha/beta hydrolase [Tenggerimyces flavus]|uniref:Alpha/beta hydrolase family protein n=1 Tax=Tenggerimyces flavus TaxID=1708749 RepID=A0ABV7YCP5_9ACTN|nr:alpha/beta hydrolase [Tenggerimyces flavus]MBM7788051.1 hypothetical protein [Tenggerimyces flavus]